MSKIDKIFWILILLLIWWEITSGLWRDDLTTAGIIVFYIALCVALYNVGHRLRGRSMRYSAWIYWCVFGMAFLVTDASMIVVVNATTSFQPWMLPVSDALLAAGMTCIALAALMRGLTSKS